MKMPLLLNPHIGKLAPSVSKCLQMAAEAIEGEKAFQKAGDATWLAYAVYGHPDLKVQYHYAPEQKQNLLGYVVFTR